jgi:hypothetical protein
MTLSQGDCSEAVDHLHDDPVPLADLQLERQPLAVSSPEVSSGRQADHREDPHSWCSPLGEAAVADMATSVAGQPR